MAQLALPWWVGANAVVGIAAIIAASGRGLALALGSVGMGAVVVSRSRGTGSRLDSTSDCVAARTFTIEVANVFTDNREMSRAAQPLVEHEPDVLIVTELTTEARADILAADNATYANPVHVEPIVGEYVVGIFTKDPAPDGVVRMVGDLRVTQASIMVDDLAVRVVGVHPDAPTTRAGFRRWKGQLRSLRGILDEAGPLTVIAGDFNAGPVQSLFENLLRGPFSDAHRSCGRGLLPSWGRPTWMPRWFPPLVARLDHVLLGPGLEAVEVEDLDAIGSDHRPCFVTIRIRSAHLTSA